MLNLFFAAYQPDMTPMFKISSAERELLEDDNI